MSLFRKLVGVFQAAGLSIRKRLLGGLPPVFVEDVFSTTLYTGNGTTSTFATGIDLSTYGGLSWIKRRNGSGTEPHVLVDTIRGSGKYIASNSTDAQIDNSAYWTYVFGTNTSTISGSGSEINNGAGIYASWTFREQPKFFDIVTYTGNGVSSRQISHSLASNPGCIIIKCTSQGGTPSGWIVPADWWVYHRGLSSPSNFSLRLNTTAVQNNSGGLVADTSTFTVYGTSTASNMPNNISGETYVAYLFAHNAGGFGLTGTDNVISCGGYTGDGAAGGQLINLGYEAQWVMIKETGSTGGWWMVDIMRGYQNSTSDFEGDASFDANTTATEANQIIGHPSALGFTAVQDNVNQSGRTYIYIAIRRGPMKVPTVGTSVFGIAYEGSTTPAVQSSFPIDFGIWTRKDLTSDKKISSRLVGAKKQYLNATTIEGSNDANLKWDYQNGYKVSVGASGDVDTNWMFRRAPGFFDVVCALGTLTSNQRISHNLTAVPELIIAKGRDRANYWMVYFGSINTRLYLNTTDAASTVANGWGTAAPTTTDFGINSGSIDLDNFNGVFYLFATCAGVSKVGSYTGTGTTLQINCGFTGGARFILIKRTDSTGDWYVWDTTRGIISGNDPYLLFNSTATEVTNTDYIDPYSAGFELSSTAPAAINANGGTYIFLAIA